MKKLVLFFVVLFVVSGVYAQEQGKFRGQGGLVYGGDTELGINLGVQYFVVDQVAIAPSYSFFLKDFAGHKYSSLNIEGRYYFHEGIYGLAGVDIVMVKGSVDIPGFDSVESSGSSAEIAIGAGYDLELNEDISINFQAKYANQIVLGVGAVYAF